MPTLTIPHIRQRLATHAPQRYTPTSTTRQAAVAIVVRDNGDCTEILFIKRADKEGDPWSGHMAFPGGHRDPIDYDLTAAAIRETMEETGLVLQRSQLIGELSQQRAAPRGRTINMIIAPFVFHIEGDPTFTPNHEVAEVVWGPMPAMIDGSIHDIENHHIGAEQVPFNGYRLERGHFVWGLTYRTLQTLFEVLDPDYAAPDGD